MERDVLRAEKVISGGDARGDLNVETRLAFMRVSTLGPVPSLSIKSSNKEKEWAVKTYRRYPTSRPTQSSAAHDKS